MISEMGDKIGVVIGMGNLWDKDQRCKTTIGGPDPFKTCKMPYFYKENHSYDTNPQQNIVFFNNKENQSSKHLVHLDGSSKMSYRMP